MTFYLAYNSARPEGAETHGHDAGNAHGDNPFLDATRRFLCEGVLGYNYTLTGPRRDELRPVDGEELAFARAQAGCA